MLTRRETHSIIPMQYPLHCHPDSARTSFCTVDANANLTQSGALALRYRLHGAADALCIPVPAAPRARDGLWQHTCFEAFVAAVDEPGYREFNFSPSGEWASYRFTAYRERDAAPLAVTPPQTVFRRSAGGFELNATLAPEMLPPGKALAIGLTAVLEATDGSKSYWALAHCAAKPDFHLRASFSLTLQRTMP